MRNFMRWFAVVKKNLKAVHLVDRCLILFMFLLLVQLTVSLFITNYDSSATNGIDVVIRTSIAGIFGYFLSANFVKYTTNPPYSTTDITSDTKSNTKSDTTSATTVLHLDEKEGDSFQKRTQQIGFSSPSKASPTLSKSNKPVVKNTVPSSVSANQLQIIIITCVGIFCLIVLIVIRNVSFLVSYTPTNHGSSATISQFRDIVSGCVGFLIGCPTSKPDP